MTLSGVLKDILLVVASMMIFHDPVSGLQAFGYSIALGGLVYYKLGSDKLKVRSLQISPSHKSLLTLLTGTLRRRPTRLGRLRSPPPRPPQTHRLRPRPHHHLRPPRRNLPKWLRPCRIQPRHARGRRIRSLCQGLGRQDERVMKMR